MIKSHFENCPYSCNDKGKILDVQTGHMIDCPYCSKKKKELLAEGVAVEEETDNKVPLHTLLGINSKYLTQNFVFNTLIPEGEKMFLEEDSINYLEEETTDLYHLLTIGELPTKSYCFGISIKGQVDRLAYPLLATAYLRGLSVCRFITCSEFLRVQLKADESIKDFYEADVVIMLIGEGSTKGEISCAKGLMQTRALKGKATIFISTWTIEACSLLLGYRNSEDTLFLASPVFVKYRNSKKSSNYINQLTGVDNSMYNPKTDMGGQGFSLKDL